LKEVKDTQRLCATTCQIGRGQDFAEEEPQGNPIKNTEKKVNHKRNPTRKERNQGERNKKKKKQKKKKKKKK